MITIHHTLLDGRLNGIIVNGENLISGWQWVVLLNGFVFVGVNVFILISGFYGIKFKWKGVLNLFVCCAFYMFLNFLIQKYMLGEEEITGGLILRKSLTSMTHTPKWFIPCYVVLYFLSPLLNAAIESMTKRHYLYGLGVLSAYCLWFGYVRHACAFNNNGYAVGQFIWLYFIGGYIKRFVTMETLKRFRGLNVSLWLVSSVLWGGATILLYQGIYVPLWRPITYNNPFTLIGSVAFFCIFPTYHFYSKTINYLAKCVLAVYLLNLPVRYFPSVEIFVLDWGMGLYLVFCIIWSFARLGAATLIDHLRLGIMLPINYSWSKMEKVIAKRWK
jgi:surface polysaccharide O-acyltransferase-like enzyme